MPLRLGYRAILRVKRLEQASIRCYQTRPQPPFNLIRDHFTKLHSPAFGKIRNATDLAAHPTRHSIAFTGSIRDSLEGGSSNRICLVDYQRPGSKVWQVTRGGGNDRCPRWSVGGVLAFLSDRARSGVFQPYLLGGDEDHLGEAVPIPSINGSVESISWSPGGQYLLVLSAELGADQGGATGGTRHDNKEASGPAWQPTIESSDRSEGWRSAWIYDLFNDNLSRVATDLNIWEACWAGTDRLLAVASEGPTESDWYKSVLTIFDLRTGNHSIVHRPRYQIGLPAASTSGSYLAAVECLSSDREGVAGDVLLLEGDDRKTRKIDLDGVDATQISWEDEFNVLTSTTTEYWSSPYGCGNLYPEVTATADGSLALLSESYNSPQKLLYAGEGRTRDAMSFAHPGTEWLQIYMGEKEDISWTSLDRLQITGYLCRPQNTQGPTPLILNVHGGPVYTFLNKFQLASPIIPLLVSLGYSVLCANPRGSIGRGQKYCAAVLAIWEVLMPKTFSRAWTQ